MKVLVISGFLGSGKTTFIQELARRTGRDFVVYENEYGQADIDAQLLRSDAELEVWESTENCICCTGKQDFASSVLTIANTLDPEFLVVEPTGVAKLSSILENLRKIAYERITLLAPVTIVDASAWERQRAAHPDIFEDQLSHAASAVVSKLSRAERELPPGLEELLAELAPTAEPILSPYDHVPDVWWVSLLGRDLDGQALSPDAIAGTGAGGNADDEGLESFSIGHAELPTPAHLMWLLDALSAGVFGEVERAKGYLPCGSEWLRFDVVGRAWALTGTEAADEARCVFIGRDLYRNGLREVFVAQLWRSRAEIRHHHDPDGHHTHHDHNHDDHDHTHGARHDHA